LFLYKAKNLSGEEISGRYHAKDASEIDFMLKDQGFFVTESRMDNAREARRRMFEKVGARDLALFCRQMAALLQAGVTISDSVAIVRDQSENKRFKAVLDVVYGELQRGKLLSEALAQHDKVFPSFLLSMVKVGEYSGYMDDIVGKLADYYENDFKTRNKIRSAMTYPIILLVLMAGVIVLLLTKIVPMFNDMLTGMDVELPLITRGLIGFSEFVLGNFVMIIAAILLIVVVFTRYVKSKKGSLSYDGFKLRMPIFGGITTKIVTARFSRSMGILLKSGIPVINAIEIMSELIGNKYVEHKFQTCKDEIREGRGIAAPIERAGIFPPLLVQMLSVGESTGELDNMLTRTAAYFDDEVQNSLQKLTTFIEPILLVILAGIVSVVILAVMMPMVEIMNSI